MGVGRDMEGKGSGWDVPPAYDGGIMPRSWASLKVTTLGLGHHDLQTQREHRVLDYPIPCMLLLKVLLWAGSSRFPRLWVPYARELLASSLLCGAEERSLDNKN